ncbi:3-beta hydroxysteroid dehydrogenase/isomerase family-domain-containing protein [Daldinia vernicosa]|uniref:3-beta hydroxysteroid dehydrogenase/isomerase family-domain-containing protein n=1 Tax=Daldinia vernicosa TaxID=114800 RepID=UPI0020079FFD|nr:3-beta hydroxysteroid dehydrogenase/isomerase family-domain-containing protein [Daldinia vernicosa]KAI0854154.1 3-beta hydroxysteroid dehydrogenase/isomerase family-domain-containing protein [Daldinia vernicosa]
MFCPILPLSLIFQRVNVVGARNLLPSARKIKTTRAFINTYTWSIIHDHLADENSPILNHPAQKRVYTAEAEAEILASNRENGNSSMLTVSVRPATVFGERDTITMGNIIANTRQGKAEIQMSPRANIYGFVYVSNVVYFQILAAEALVRAIWKSSSTICIVPIIGEWTTWLRTSGKGHPIVTREVVRLVTITRILNGERSNRVPGYKPGVSMGEGLAKAGEWFRKEAERPVGKKSASVVVI